MSGLCEATDVDILGGERLIQRRTTAGYTRDEFAPLVGITVRTLEGWEAKAGRVPDKKRGLVERMLEQPKVELTTLELLSILASRLAMGEAASKQLSLLERDHPELFQSDDDEAEPADVTSGVEATQSGYTPSAEEQPSRGTRGRAPRRRIKGDDET